MTIAKFNSDTYHHQLGSEYWDLGPPPLVYAVSRILDNKRYAAAGGSFFPYFHQEI